MKHHAGVIIEIHFLPDGQEWDAVDPRPKINTDGGWNTWPPFVAWGDRVMSFGDYWVGALGG